MFYLESSLENHHYLPLLVPHLLAHQTILAMFPYCPKHLYLYYSTKLLETSLALQLQFHRH
nr:MAG TPA: hypothetical protein [Caudoviricetes sp.]